MYYGFLSSAKFMGRNSCKTISKNLSGKYSQKLLDNAKQSATDALKTAEVTGGLTGNKTADRITRPPHRIKKKYLKKNIYLQKKDSK